MSPSMVRLYRSCHAQHRWASAFHSADERAEYLRPSAVSVVHHCFETIDTLPTPNSRERYVSKVHTSREHLPRVCIRPEIRGKLHSSTRTTGEGLLQTSRNFNESEQHEICLLYTSP